MILVGDPNADHGEIPIHTDNDDYITALVSIGTNNIRSGHTNYYETRKKNSYMLSHSVEFKNLNIQIGNFDKVYHGSSEWRENLRAVISFSLQKN